ncbi:SAUR-like auxin-responsive protein family [Zostera marina]|uniref:SAUR-like auxin-responsive protein family n=1 Tax=Zostera marina TaxID=29655 RepID=A0A0K9PRD5_ZOSMR|nr:SAUR-like auxin-responsive protein family [Zostera marina]
MANGFQTLGLAKQVLRRSLSFRNRAVSSESACKDVPRGHFPVYVGESEKRFVVPVSYLKCPLFQKFLERAEEEFGVDHQMGALKVPCKVETFVELTSQIKG